MPSREYQVLLVEGDPAGVEFVQRLLSAADGMHFRVHAAPTLVLALDALVNSTFDIALVELTLPDCKGMEVLDTIRRNAPTLPILVFTTEYSEAMALTAVQRGAQDYVVKTNITTSALVRILQYTIVRYQNSVHTTEEAKPANTIGFIGAKGGVGTTTIATHMALSLCRAGRVLLIDTDTVASGSSFLLRPDSKYTLEDAERELHKLDSDYWKGVVWTSREGLDLLQAPGALAVNRTLSPERVRHVLRFARKSYDHIVVDMGRLSPFSFSLFEQIREIYVVGTTTLPEMYETSRVLRRMADLGVPASQIRLVLNRTDRSLFSQATDVEKALGYPVYWTVPDFTSSLLDAYAEGRMLDLRDPLAKQIAAFTNKVLGVQAKRRAGHSMLSFLGMAKA